METIKEIITTLLFGTVFAAGFTMGIFSAIGIYYSLKRKKEIDQEEEESIAEQEDITIENKHFSVNNLQEFEEVICLMEKSLDSNNKFTLKINKCSFNTTGIPDEMKNRFDKCIKQMDPEKANIGLKTLRDYCIDITKYTYEQRNNIYRLLIYLNEPIFRGYDNVVTWISKDYKPTIVISSFMQFIGFSEQNGWIELSKSEVKSKNLTEVDYNTFIKIMNGTDLYSTYQELFNHMDEEHDLILLQSEMDDIIRIVNGMKKGS